MNNLTYRACKSQIERKSYISKEDMQQKLDIFLVGNRINQDEYTELTDTLTVAYCHYRNIMRHNLVKCD
ncbi:hypothetical protein KDN24_12805 [Bacillus sp. Bva_UNVM-123]|uniref:hypothetical protein n=1 Tax=Bacillus sp. Bva_UNVM-123 TaxID=2829798 RepID=UPI00391F3340